MINRRRKRNVNKSPTPKMHCRSIFTTLQKMKANAFHGIIILVHSQVCVETLVVHHRQCRMQWRLPLRLPRSNQHAESHHVHRYKYQVALSDHIRSYYGRGHTQINFITLNEETTTATASIGRSHFRHTIIAKPEHVFALHTNQKKIRIIITLTPCHHHHHQHQ